MSPGRGRKPTPKPPKTGLLKRLPPAPKDMHPAGQREWKRAGRHLIERGVLSDTDMQAFQTYCQVIANLAMHAEGKGDVKTMGSFNQLATLQRQYANEFGLTPTSRERIGTEEYINNDNDLSQLDL